MAEQSQHCSSIYCRCTFKQYIYNNNNWGTQLDVLMGIGGDVFKDVGGDVFKDVGGDVSKDGKETSAGIKQIHKELKLEAWCAVPEPPSLTVGLDTPLEELRMILLKDGVSMVVLSAPGGCGKTTLAAKFYRDKKVNDKFKNNIFFVNVSKTPNVIRIIVQELYRRNSYQVPTLPDDETAVLWLREFLKEGQNHVLLVLDDVWSESKYLLEKFDEVKMPNFKILVASRSQFPRFGPIYRLKTLNERDAIALFRHYASLEDGQWNSLARKIAAHCKGYPLAIEVVGKSLRGKDFVLWRKRERDLSEGVSIINSKTKVFRCLQSSLNALDGKKAIIRECFLDLACFPREQRIPAAALIDMWAELYDKLAEDFLAVAILYKLTSRSLADLVVTRKETVEDDDYYCEHFVTQHDLLRQLAVYQAIQDPSKKRLIMGNGRNNLPQCLTEQKHQPIKPRVLSISSDGTFSTNLHNIELADVEVLVLFFNTKNYALPEFVKNMYNLKVLIVTNLGSVPAELSNFHLLNSLPNLKRIRLERVSIPSKTKHRIQVKSLKKISFFMCSIGQVFSNCSFQISDALPNLEELNVDFCNDLVELPDELCSLVRLKKISITNCHKLSDLPREIGKLDKLEVLRLRSCSDLAKLPCSVKNLGSLNCLDVSDCVSIEELPKDIGKLSSLSKIHMRQCSRLQELPPSVRDLEQLEEVVCDEETQGLWKPFLPRLCKAKVRVVKEKHSLDWLRCFS